MANGFFDFNRQERQPVQFGQPTGIGSFLGGQDAQLPPPGTQGTRFPELSGQVPTDPTPAEPTLLPEEIPEITDAQEFLRTFREQTAPVEEPGGFSGLADFLGQLQLHIDPKTGGLSITGQKAAGALRDRKEARAEKARLTREALKIRAAKIEIDGQVDALAATSGGEVGRYQTILDRMIRQSDEAKQQGGANVVQPVASPGGLESFFGQTPQNIPLVPNVFGQR